MFPESVGQGTEGWPVGHEVHQPRMGGSRGTGTGERKRQRADSLRYNTLTHSTHTFL